IQAWQGGLIFDLIVYDDVLIASGSFHEIAGQQYINIVGWTGELQSVGGGLINAFYPSSGARTVGLFRGELIACGDFQSAGRVPVDHVAVWNGNQWRSFPGIPPDVAIAD